MRILIAGIDGYLGWALAQSLAKRGHEIAGIDLGLRRAWVEEMGSCSAIPIASIKDRVEAFEKRYGSVLSFWDGDLRDYDTVASAMESFRPEAVVQLGECPSAPYSMIDREHSVFVQTNNIVGTFNLLFAIRDIAPEAHLVKLGTMGEYGTPSVDIPEGFFQVTHRGRTDTLPFPRQAGSWYHWSKVHGSNNVMFACKIYGLRATDVMQGVVFGTRFDDEELDPKLRTRFDFDQAFGTAINRFCAQAVIGHPLTLFGKGHQKRGFIPLRESMACLTLAIENPPQAGEYRVFNQFAEVCDITDLGMKVQAIAKAMGINATVRHIENPRRELEEHYYNPDHDNLRRLGYTPRQTVEAEVTAIIEDLRPHRDVILAKRDILMPDVQWNGKRKRANFVDDPSPALKR